jgi:hypothetical protein
MIRTSQINASENKNRIRALLFISIEKPVISYMLIQYGLLKYLYLTDVSKSAVIRHSFLQQVLNVKPAEAETDRWLSPNAEV